MNKRRPFASLAGLLLALALLVMSGPALAARKDAVAPNYIKMSKKSVTVLLDETKAQTYQLSVTVKPEEAVPTAEVTWRSDDPAVATVDENGLVTVVESGKTTIYASVQGETKPLEVSCSFKVKAISVRSVKLNHKNVQLDLDAGENTVQLKATVNPSKASRRVITWESSDPAVATVDENGKVTVLRKGRCTVTAACDRGEETAICKIIAYRTSNLRAVTFTAGGDIVLGGDKVKNSDKRFESLIYQSGKADYGYVFRNLLPLFKKDDFTILNLEGPLYGRSSPGREDREFNFAGKPEYVNILIEGSVEIVNVVNNHISDYGTKHQTVELLRSKGIGISNVNPTVYTFNGVRVGFIGFLTPASMYSVKNKCEKASLSCDLLVASFHFCDVPEHVHKLYSRQVTMARAAVNGGADLVLGHHTHVPSGIQLVGGVYAYYGLGSVESSGIHFGRKDMYNTFVTQQTLLCDPEVGCVIPQVPTIYPICPTSAPVNKPNNCQPMLLPPTDYRYNYVFNVIDNNSSTSGYRLAPYVKGKP